MNMTEKEYRAHPGQGSHDLMRALTSHERWVERASAATSDMVVGSAAHCLLLEPDQFDDRFAQAPTPPPECVSTATAARQVLVSAGVAVKASALASEIWAAYIDAGFVHVNEWLARWHEQHPGVTTIESAEHDRALGIAKAVRHDRHARALLDRADACEVPHVWEDAGVQCKRKRDICGRLSGWFADLKTTNDPYAWTNEIRWKATTTLLQMAHYGGTEETCYIIAAQSVAPFAVVTLQLAPELIEYGEERRRVALARVRRWQAEAELAAFEGRAPDYGETGIVMVTRGGAQW